MTHWVLLSPSHTPIAPSQGGVENMVIGWADELSRRGHRVTVASLVPGPPQTGQLPGRSWSWVTVPGAADLPGLGGDHYVVQQHPAWAAFLDPDRVVVVVHNRPSPRGPFGVFPTAPTWADSLDGLRRIPRLAACSHWLAHLLEVMTGRSDVAVVYPGVDDAFSRAAQTARVEPALYAGRLLRRKGLDLLIQLADSGDLGCPLDITDYAPPSIPHGEAEAIRGRALQSRNVTLIRPGRTPAEVAAIMARHPVLVLPSLGEPFGMVAIEAQAAGSRLVCWADAGLVETAGPAAELVPGGDRRTLVAAVRRAMAADPPLDRWRRDISDRFSMAASTTALEAAAGAAPSRPGPWAASLTGAHPA